MNWGCDAVIYMGPVERSVHTAADVNGGNYDKLAKHGENAAAYTFLHMHRDKDHSVLTAGAVSEHL